MVQAERHHGLALVPAPRRQLEAVRRDRLEELLPVRRRDLEAPVRRQLAAADQS